MSAQAPGYVSCTADTLAKSGTGVLYGFSVTVTTATAAISLYDSTTEAGTVLAVIPIGIAAGTTVHFPQGIRFKTGLYVGYGASGTGTVVVMFD